MKSDYEMEPEKLKFISPDNLPFIGIGSFFYQNLNS
jgi:hypothetical protein